MKQKWKLPFPVLADADNAYAKRLGIAFELPDDLRAVYASFAIDLPAFHDANSWELPLPTRILVSRDGTIARIDADPDYTVRPEAHATLDALRALDRGEDA